MDDRLTIAAWTLAGAGLFALLGAAFGAVAGALAWAHGKAAGGYVGRAFAEALDRVRDEPLSPTAKGAVIGGTDGAAFLAVVGGILGAVLGYRGDVPPQVGAYVVLAGVALALAAGLFGLTAYGLLRAGVWALGAILAGAIAGALLGGRLAGRDGILYGILVGGLVGALPAVFRGGRRKRAPAEPPAD